ncbi:hypothetical protein MKX34_23995 [Paenibacillus sp. FSL R5-0636]|uniref:hypothetical protein n=1 Tax=Paenibacillus TaxID=44249 RepID=UPI00096FAFF1|nr:hypothetical protein [Paenibacillus odorifer]OMC96229.1 hypothetical protein BJP49_11045 [Paenibacillus odorifer]
MMNAKLTAMIVALGAYAITLSDAGFEIPEEMDAEIDELIAAGDEFATGISDAESDAVLFAQLTGMLDAIKAELSPPEPKIAKELYVLAHVDSNGNVTGYPKGGGSSAKPSIKAHDSLSSAKRSRGHCGGTIMRITAMEPAE